MSEEKRRHPNVVNLSEVPAKSHTKGSRFGYTSKWLGHATGARGIGCSWYEVPPGCAAYPAHYHCANEEAVFILEGEGAARIGTEKVSVKAGDFITFPPGPESAHQLINTGTVPLRYLALSTMHTVEVVGYPDSKKLGAMALTLAGGQPKAWVRELFRPAGLDYYDGEDVG